MRTFSNHIGSSSELLVLADIKPGFVPIRSPITYAARLRRHLKLVDALRRSGLETESAGNYVGPIDSLRTLQFITWTMIDNDTRMLLSVNFDQPFEPYIRRIVDVSGGLLDSVFCHCVGFDGCSSDQGFHKFMAFIEANQAPVELFAASAPNTSVDDTDFYLEADANIRSGAWEDPALAMARHKLTSPPEKLLAAAARNPDQLLHQSFRILRALFGLAPFFPPNPMAPEGQTSDDVIYYNLVRTLMPGLWELLIRRVPGLSDADKMGLIAGLDPADPGAAYKAVHQGNDPARDPLLDHLLQTYAEPLAWFGYKPRGQAAVIKPEPRAPGSVQAGLLAPAAKHNVAAMMLLRVDDPGAGRAFLTHMESRLWPEKPQTRAWNLSITREGLYALGVHEDRLAKFPRAFMEGMTARAGLLGDTDVNHPNVWVWPKGNWPLGCAPRAIAPQTIDIIVQVSGAAKLTDTSHIFDQNHPLHADVAALAKDLPEGVTLQAVEPMQSRFDPETPGRAVGHLGFEDGISQPRLDGSREYDAADEHPLRPPQPERARIGDILLGHSSKLDPEGLFEPVDTPLRDGTFQVIRKLRIDRRAFHEAASSVAGDDLPEALVKAKMMGRWQDGTPLAKDAVSETDFDHSADPHGADTPLQSHVRRCNPREAKTPRILRRGYSYGPYDGDDDADRGLMFICYNASLAEQFEIIQRWVAGGNSTGIASGHGDPLLSPKRPGEQKVFRFVHGAEGAERVVSINLPDRPVGQLQWGTYAFTPSLEGLRSLADATIAEAPEDAALAPLPNLPQTKEAWQRVLEDGDEARRAERRQIWAHIQTEGGARRSDYGVLVGGAQAMRDLLSNKDDAFAAQPYLDRMLETVGPQFLGFDRTQAHKTQGFDHDREAAEVWGFMNEIITAPRAFEMAYSMARESILARPREVAPTAGGALNGPDMGRMVSMHRLINNVSAWLCRDMFGLAGADMDFGGPEVPMAPRAHCPGDFLNTAAYIFGPHPSPQLAGYAQMRGQLVRAALDGLVAQGGAPEGTLLGHLRQLQSEEPYWDDAKIASVLSSVTTGLVAPVMGSFMMCMLEWITTGMIWRHQQKLQEAGVPEQSEALFAHAQRHLLPFMVAAQRKRTAPDLVQRTAVKDTQIGGCPVHKGDHVIGSLGAAAQEEPESALSFFFGGDYGTAVHACPGKDAGLAAVMGCIMAVLSFEHLEYAGPIALRIKE
ncbi:MAG: hypothetical protein AAF744_04025 [Pseudomonadota bacterium]